MAIVTTTILDAMDDVSKATLVHNVKVGPFQSIITGTSSTILSLVAMGIDAHVSPGKALGVSCGATPFPFVVNDIVCPLVGPSSFSLDWQMFVEKVEDGWTSIKGKKRSNPPNLHLICLYVLI